MTRKIDPKRQRCSGFHKRIIRYYAFNLTFSIFRWTLILRSNNGNSYEGVIFLDSQADSPNFLLRNHLPSFVKLNM